MSNDRNDRPPPNLGAMRPDRDGPFTQPRRPAPPPRHHPQPAFDPHADALRRRPVSHHAAPPSRFGGDNDGDNEGSGLGRIALYVVMGLLGVIAIGIGALAVLFPAELVRDRVAAEVERQTGRKLTVGSTRVSFATGAAVTLSQLSLSAPPAMGGEPLLTADRLEVSLALLPLVLREVKVERLALLRPVVNFRVDAQGRRSWDFAAAPGVARPLRYAQAGGRANDAQRLPAELKDFAKNSSPPHAVPDSGPPLGLEGLSLADVRITDGVFRYSEASAGIAREVRGIDADIALPNIGGPLDVSGHFVVGGERIAVEGRLETLRDIMAERPATVRLKLNGKPLTATYDGKITAATVPSADGRLYLRASSAEGLAHLLELPVAGLEGVGLLSIDGAVKASASSLSLSSANWAVSDMSGTGAVSVDIGQPRPRVVANLRLAALDLDRVSALAQVTLQPSAAGRFAAPSAAPLGPPKSIDDLLKGADPGPTPPTRVRGFRQRAGNQWDVEAIDLSRLKGFDLDGRFQVAELKSGHFQATGVSASVELKDSVLRANVTEGEIGGGKVRGLGSIDLRQPALAVGVNLSGDGVAVMPLLAAAGIDLIEGRGRVVVAVSARGGSERELVSTLAGKADLKVSDGALVGWDVDRIIGGLGKGQIPQAKRQLDQRTPFRELSGTFQIANGVARSSDLRVDSATLGATGTGLVNIVDRNVDLMLKPKLGSGLVVPVRVAGPWDDPSLVADVAGALNSPQAQEAVRHLKDGNIDGALKSVLGGGAKADEKIDRAKGLLRQFLKQ